jgi:hypothetical protein
MGLALFCHCSASRIFIMQPGCTLPPVVIYKDDHQPCGGKKRAGLRPHPTLSFKDVHHPCWGGRRAELGSCLPHGLVTRFFLQHSEKKDVHQPCGGGELRLRGAGRRQAPSAAACLAPWLGWLWRRLPPPSGARPFVYRTGDCRVVRRSATSMAHCSDVAQGVVQDVVRHGGGGRILGWSCPHPRRRTEARTFPHAVRRPPSPVSHWCRGGRYRRC